jgi:aspartate/methionine/tyrosine aminotransferase
MSVKALAYEDVISLGIGEPDFDTPAEICEAALMDAKAGHTHYTPSRGYPELIQELADLIRTRYGITLDDAQLMITHGGMGGLAAFLRTVLEPGQQVLVPEPHFPTYSAQICFTGAQMVSIPTRFEDGFIIQPDAVRKALTPHTKALILNSPNNPTGSVTAGDVLDALAEIANEHDLLILSDEVYDRMVYRGSHESIYTRPGMAERTVVVNSFSKAYAMTGWRMGYAYGPAWLIEEMLKVAMYTTSCPSSVGQRAAMSALRMDRSRFEAMTREFGERCDLVFQRLQKMPDIRVKPTAGSFYSFPNVAEINPDCVQFAFDLLDQEQVIVIPGSAFGPSGKGFVRLACTVDKTRLSEAMDRLQRFVMKHR